MSDSQPRSKEAVYAEERIEQAFAEISPLEIALRRNVPPVAAIPLAALQPPQAAFDFGAELLIASAEATPAELQERKEVAVSSSDRPTPAEIFALALKEEEGAAPQAEVGDGYLAALAPVEQPPEILPDMEPEADEGPIVRLPDAADLIPTPTPRPDYPPVASLPPEEPVTPEPAPPQAEPEVEPEPEAEASRPSAAAPEPQSRPEPPVASRQPEPQPAPPVAARREAAPARASEEPSLPESLLPTRPPAGGN